MTKIVNVLVEYCNECPFSYRAYEEEYGKPMIEYVICQLTGMSVWKSTHTLEENITIPESCKLPDKMEIL